MSSPCTVRRVDEQSLYCAEERNDTSLSLSLSLCDMCQDFHEKDSIESRCVIGPENILLAGMAVHLSARTFYRTGQ